MAVAVQRQGIYAFYCEKSHLKTNKIREYIFPIVWCFHCLQKLYRTLANSAASNVSVFNFCEVRRTILFQSNECSHYKIYYSSDIIIAHSTFLLWILYLLITQFPLKKGEIFFSLHYCAKNEYFVLMTSNLAALTFTSKRNKPQNVKT